MKLTSSLILVIALIVLSCRKPHHDPPPPPTPGKATLVAPDQNAACTQGTVVSNSQRIVLFQWTAASNTDSYELDIKNLLDGSIQTQQVPTTEFTMTLNRGVPYSWWVVAKSNQSTTTTQSNVWKFYLAGDGQSSYAPFPADVVAPQLDGQVAAGSVTLKWSCSDADNDLIDYDIYGGTSSSPSLLQSHVTTTQLTGVNVTSGTTYYWKVVSRDNKGNTATSNLFSFTVN